MELTKSFLEIQILLNTCISMKIPVLTGMRHEKLQTMFSQITNVEIQYV